MNFFKKTRIYFLAVTLAGAASTSLIQAQDTTSQDFNEEVLSSFVEANVEVSKIQQQAEQKMMNAIEGADLEVERFNQILMAKQQNQEADAGEDELKNFDSAAQQIMQIQQETQQEIMQEIQQSGLEPQQYQEIIMAYQQDPSLKEKLDKMVEEKMKNQPQQGMQPGAGDQDQSSHTDTTGQN